MLRFTLFFRSNQERPQKNNTAWPEITDMIYSSLLRNLHITYVEIWLQQ